MGEMADMYADMATSIPDWMLDDDHPTGYNSQNRFDEFRDDVWQAKDGQVVKIKDMTSRHLLNAYKVFGDERFKNEMLIRMFEDHVNKANKFVW